MLYTQKEKLNKRKSTSFFHSSISNHETIEDSINQHMRKELLLPPYKSFDPIYFASKIFRKCFVPNHTDFDSYQTAFNNEQNFYKKFSSYCFDKGTLASAILKGEGKIMMLAAYKQSLEHPSTLHQQSKILYGSRMSSKKASHINIYYNQCYKSACGIVFNASSQANRILSNIKKAIEQDEEQSEISGNAFEEILPFISTKREVALLNEYKHSLINLKKICKSPTISEEELSHIKKKIYILEKSINKVNTIIQKKNMHRLNFLTSIQNVWDRLHEFEQNLTYSPIRNPISISSAEGEDSDNPTSDPEEASHDSESENEQV
ncbi:MAG: hypothetical protein N4A62_20585 [Marinisporobacter sp.]|jgi:hypothetical protein|nr:hypothetical protein [Marinisporobacter sp.]